MRIDPSAVYNQLKKTTGVDKEASVKNSKALPKEGQAIKGEILDSNQTGVKVKLSDGRVIQARLSGDFQFSIGEEVNFVVKESTGDLLVLTPDITTMDQATDKMNSILQNANLPTTKENQAMLTLLIKNNMPIDSQSLNDMARLQKQYPNASMKQLVFMTKHQIPVTNESLQQLSMLENNEHALMKGIASLAEDISTSEGLSKNEQQVLTLISEDKGAIEFLKDVNKVLAKLEAGEKLPVMNSAQALIANKADAVSLNTVVTADGSKVTVEGNLATTDVVNTVTAELAHAASTTNTESGTNSPLQTNVLSAVDGGSSPNIAGTVEGVNNVTQSEGAEPLQGQYVTSEAPIKEMMMAADFEKLATAFKGSTGVSLPDNVSLNDFQTMVKDGLISHDQLRAFMSEVKEDSTYHTIAKGLLISENDLEDVTQLKDYFNKLHEKVNSLIESNSDLFSSESAVAKEATNVKASVEFMSALNQDFNLLHLPMLLGDQLLNSELYIMNDRKTLKKDDDTLTALVRLDLLNLGHTDIYVKKTSKNVDVTFYMSDESQIQVMKDNAFKLHKVLRDKGFNTMGINVAALTDGFDVTKDFLNEDGESAEMKRYTFDMRA